MKFVIEYSHGDIECTCEFVQCIEYASKAALTSDLETAALELSEKNALLQAQWKKWDLARPTFDGRKKPAEREEKMGKWLQSRPTENASSDVLFHGLKIPLEVVENSWLAIYELDEWFAMKVGK